MRSADSFGNALGDSIVGQIEETNGEQLAAQLEQGLQPIQQANEDQVNQQFVEDTQQDSDEISAQFQQRESLSNEAASIEQDNLANAEAAFTAPPPVAALAPVALNIAPSMAASDADVAVLNAGQAQSDADFAAQNPYIANPLIGTSVTFPAGSNSVLPADINQRLGYVPAGQGPTVPNPIADFTNLLGQALFPNALNYVNGTNSQGPSLFESLAQQSGVSVPSGVMSGLNAFAGFGEALTNSLIGFNNLLPGQPTLRYAPISQSEGGGAAAFDVLNTGLVLAGTGVFGVLRDAVDLATGSEAVSGAASTIGSIFPSFSPDGAVFANQIGAMGVRPSTIVQPAAAYDVGTAADLYRASVPGDALDIHHVVQKAPAFQLIEDYNASQGAAIALPVDEHQAIPTVSSNFDGTPRDLLALDMRNLRAYTNAPNQQLIQLIQLNKQLYPNAFLKVPTGQ